jgi:hypothetical protein
MGVCSILILLLLWEILDAEHNDVPFLKDPDSLSSNRARLLQYLPPYLVLCVEYHRESLTFCDVSLSPFLGSFHVRSFFSAASSSDTSVFSSVKQKRTDGRTE